MRRENAARGALHTMNRPRLTMLACGTLFCLLLRAPDLACGDAVPDPARGLYAIWSRPEITDGLPFLKGDQVRLQWSEVQPAADRYDFSSLDRQLQRVAKLGRWTTVQLNANRHPEFLYRLVPSVKGEQKKAETDQLLQYWHPAYVKAYTDLIAAFARAVKSSPDHSRVIGVRLNYNAIGTEFVIVRPEQRDPAHWSAPPGVTVAGAWTEEIAAGYRRQVVDTFRRNFNPEIRVLLRTGNPQYPGPDSEALDLLGTGNLGIFTTASEIEPRMPTMFIGDRPIFLDYCRTGKTVGYAESMAYATGKHGPMQDPRWCSPEQYNYWRLLSDLNLGFSMIGVYGADLARADQPEFRAAFDFAARYAGYHASPSVAPGAWVALREGGLRLKGDYTFLMRRLSGTKLKAERKVGPDDQRFGAWAHTLPAGGAVTFALDSDFARSLEGKKALLRVVYLDRGAGRFTIRASGKTFEQAVGDSGRWKTAQFDIDHAAITADGEIAHIALDTEGDLTLHMIEIARTPISLPGAGS
jgi:hypothetical protein